MQHGELGFLTFGLVLLTAAVLSVPIARRLGLSAIVAYLIAGIVIGPHGLAAFGTPESIIPVSELGVVMLLFLIGLELELGRLVALRRAIFGLGAAQLALTALAIGVLAYLVGLVDWRGAVVAGVALAMSATAIALEILEERGQLQQDYGQRAFAILLFQDMAVVPLLAALPLLAQAGGSTHTDVGDGLRAVALIVGAILLIVVAGRYLLNPFFRLLAQTGSREVMTAAALLVVLGAALIMQKAGMSMALGAFLAGVLLAESNYRHELEADIEPFRGLLLALFFMGIGMSIDLAVVRANVWLILVAAVVITALKAGIVWLLFRATCVREADALRAGSVLTAAGEFAFVLIPLGGSLGVLDARQASILTAIAAITMLLGPLVATLTETLLRRFKPLDAREPDDFSDARGSVLVIGFGRFGQIVSQCLLAEAIDVTTIDNDPEMIQDAAGFGFKVYYGDGTRLDVLRAAGAGDARLIAVCIDNREAASRVVDLVHAEFPGTKLYVRSFDRRHTLQLIAKGVDFELRETYESALVFGRSTLEALGIDSERAAATEQFVRSRDLDLLAVQQAEGLSAGADLLRTRMVHEPLSTPAREVKPLNPEAEEIISRPPVAE
ncbi:MAG TPA: monovalent cation:proton antiporter-2 (CPA2) family protein [Xanthobacteraceae bacterium]|jgi:glutathione-regulated potassium-efflux system protein KefB|nr:monovalent cation:proton antiporter-2 (CPA2) family protein [Xanthobacteraceae bacterium]